MRNLNEQEYLEPQIKTITLKTRQIVCLSPTSTSLQQLNETDGEW